MGSGIVPVFAWIALGSNQGNKLKYLKDAHLFLRSISESPIVSSSLYETEPIGPADKPFLNALVRISTVQTPEQLLKTLKEFESSLGRDFHAPRWSNRPIDLDIIAMQKVHIELDWLQIPHKEYSHRRFVLVPLQEIEPSWIDQASGNSIAELIEKAPQSSVQKLDVSW